MEIRLNQVIPGYMMPNEVEGSEVYLQKDIDFCSPKKYLIQAQSGRGKTSLFSIIYGSLESYNGTTTNSVNAALTELWQKHISCVFQDLKLFPELSALDNVLLKNRLTNHKSSSEIETYFKELDLEFKMHSLVGELSQGQRQRVAIIRALCQPFDFLLLDEPFSHLDKLNTDKACSLILKELNQQKSGLVLMSLEDNDRFNYDLKLHL